jgi:hypothetical protein
MVQAMVGKYDEAIRLSDTGAPLSPMFDDLAALRTARAPLRSVGPALKAGETDKANAAFADFKARWASAQPVLEKYSPESLAQTSAALDQASAAMQSPGSEAAPAIDALLSSYNAGVNVVNNAARAAGYQ